MNGSFLRSPSYGVVQDDLQQGDQRPCPTNSGGAVHNGRLGLMSNHKRA
jgi:hypothetical protein